MTNDVLIWTAAAAAIASAALVLALLPILKRHALARPNARSSHRVSTPQGGGIAVIAATLSISAFVIIALHEAAFDPTSLGLVFTATAFIALVGAIDDMHSIEVPPRLVLQMFAVGLVLAALPQDMRIIAMLPWWIERALLLLGTLWFVNLVNFMDGIDWMTVAETVPIGVGLVLAGFFGALPSDGVLVAVALAGAMLGFAPFNRPVAQLFLGDVGSLPIGLLLGWLLLLLAGNGHIAAAVLLPLYYIADATITLIRRLVNGEAITSAHRKHFYQLATDGGFSVHKVVAGVFLVNIALVALAIATIAIQSLLLQLTALIVGIFIVGMLLFNFAHRAIAN